MDRINLFIDPELKKQSSAFADSHGITLSEMIRQGLVLRMEFEKELERYKIVSIRKLKNKLE